MAKLCWVTEPWATGCLNTSAFLQWLFLQTPMLMLHENFPGLHSWDVLFHCYVSSSSAKIAKFGHSCWSRRFFTPTEHVRTRSPGHTQIRYSCKLCDCALYNGFIFACWIGLHGSRSVLRDPTKTMQHILLLRSQWPRKRAAEPSESCRGKLWDRSLPKPWKVLIPQKNPHN